MTDHLEADVAIVGGGLAGLVAARRLLAAGLQPLVLEARDRFGGRLLNHEIGDGKIVEIGGQWIGPTQDRIAALGAELGIGTFPTHDEGQKVMEMDGRRTTFTDFADIGIGLLRDLSKAVRRWPWLTSSKHASGSTGWQSGCRWRRRGRRRKRGCGTARPSRPGSGATSEPQAREASSSC
jgi:monoamine oxidase